MKDRSWALLNNEHRRQILLELAKGEMSVTELAMRIPAISQPMLSTHLAELRRHKMVRWRQEDAWRIYSLDPSGVVGLRLQYERLFAPLAEAIR
jgi:ArsR family transcriptional regulator, virulence genes transcriptional regulator